MDFKRCECKIMCKYTGNTFKILLPVFLGCYYPRERAISLYGYYTSTSRQSKVGTDVVKRRNVLDFCHKPLFYWKISLFRLPGTEKGQILPMTHSMELLTFIHFNIFVCTVSIASKYHKFFNSFWSFSSKYHGYISPITPS